jgi:hypothetical protein
MPQLATEYGVSRSIIYGIRYGLTWKHLGLPVLPLTQPLHSTKVRHELAGRQREAVQGLGELLARRTGA